MIRTTVKLARRAVPFALLLAGAPAHAQRERCAQPFPPVECVVPTAVRIDPSARATGAARTPARVTAVPRAPAPAAPSRDAVARDAVPDRNRSGSMAPSPPKADPPGALQRRPAPAGAPAVPASDRLAARDELFGAALARPVEPVDAAEVTATAVRDDTLPAGRDALFGAAAAPGPAPAMGEVSAPGPGRARLRGFVQFAPAYTYASPSHWSRAVVRTQGEVTGSLAPEVKYKASLRLDVDPVYMTSNYYPEAVKRDQRANLMVRETYLDFGLGGWDLRVGRQQIVWGEVVGLFVADVVSARDARDFILPDFDILRIPQWAARAEYFAGDSHLELVWIPVPSYDNIGKPGAEFYPYVIPPTPGYGQTVLDPEHEPVKLSNTNYGLRVSQLARGWDLSGFYYRSTSAAPTLYRTVETTPVPTVVFQPRYDRIWQAGGTLTKDFGRTVLRAETVYTSGRGFEVINPVRPESVAMQNTLDYVLSLDFTLPADLRLNLQGYQRIFFDHDPDIAYDGVESGITLLVAGRLTPSVEPELLVIQSLNSNDRLLRPRVNWALDPRLAARFGVDIFAGPQYGVFGRFRDRDRVYAELRYAF